MHSARREGSLLFCVVVWRVPSFWTLLSVWGKKTRNDWLMKWQLRLMMLLNIRKTQHMRNDHSPKSTIWNAKHTTAADLTSPPVSIVCVVFFCWWPRIRIFTNYPVLIGQLIMLLYFPVFLQQGCTDLETSFMSVKWWQPYYIYIFMCQQDQRRCASAAIPPCCQPPLVLAGLTVASRCLTTLGA